MRPGAREAGNPCKACDKYGRCKKPCDRVESILPAEDEGRSGHEVRLGETFEVADGPTGDSEDPDDALQVDKIDEAKNLFWYGAEHLTRSQLRAYLLRVRDIRTFAEIGEALGCSRQAAHSHYSKALRRLTKSA